ncbi:MAG: DUF2085 domain-containing protein [Candidatus Helarchaeota archaeon]
MASKKDKLKNFFSLLLSHHTEEFYNRTFTISIRNKEIHLCARCSGVILSFIAALIFTFMTQIKLDPVCSLVTAILFVIPVLIDWGTQKLGYRESKNSIRFITGSFLGVGIALLRYTYPLQWLPFIFIAMYLVIFFIVSIKGY